MELHLAVGCLLCFAGIVCVESKEYNCNKQIDQLLTDMRPAMDKRNPKESDMMFCLPFLLYGLNTCQRNGDIIATESTDKDYPDCTEQAMDAKFTELNFTCTVDLEMFKMMMEMSGLPGGRKKRQFAMPGAGGGETATIIGNWKEAELIGDTRTCKNRRKNGCGNVRTKNFQLGNMMIGCKGTDPTLKMACSDNAFLDKIKQSMGQMIQTCVGSEIGEMFTSADDTASKFSCVQ